jgi:hypothetical protein
MTGFRIELSGSTIGASSLVPRGCSNSGAVDVKHVQVKILFEQLNITAWGTDPV